MILGALAVSGAAGLNAWLPLLLSGGLERLGWIDLASPWAWLGDTWVLALSAAMFAAQFAGAARCRGRLAIGAPPRHRPGSRVWSVIDLAVAAAAGALLFDAAAGDRVALLAALALGGGTSAVLHGARAVARPGDAPALSLLEDVAAALLVVVAFSLPVVAGAIVLALVGGAVAAAWLTPRVR